MKETLNHEAFMEQIQQIADKILWYFSLQIEEKMALGSKFKEIASKYTEELAIERYQEIFANIK